MKTFGECWLDALQELESQAPSVQRGPAERVLLACRQRRFGHSPGFPLDRFTSPQEFYARKQLSRRPEINSVAPLVQPPSRHVSYLLGVAAQVAMLARRVSLKLGTGASQASTSSARDGQVF